jgi:hypothetical protein
MKTPEKIPFIRLTKENGESKDFYSDRGMRGLDWEEIKAWANGETPKDSFYNQPHSSDLCQPDKNKTPR